MRRCCSSGRSAWGCPIGGSAWPEPAWRCSCTWQGRRDDTRSRREELLAQQQGMCKLCGAPIALGTFEIDHVIPVSQSFSGQQLELQALCLECHHTKTSLEGNHSTTRRFSRYAYQNYAATPRLPPLGLPAAAAHLLPPGGGQAGGPHVGGPALRPPQGRAGSVALRGQELVRQARLRLLAGSGAGAVAALQVEPRRLPGAGFGAHGAELAGGRGALRQTFTDAAGEKEWDHVFVTELLSNSSYRPVHDYIMGAEYVAVVRIRQALAEVPRRYLKCIKTDCLVSPRSAGPPWSGCCRCRTGTARPSIATRRSPA